MYALSAYVQRVVSDSAEGQSDPARADHTVQARHELCSKSDAIYCIELDIWQHAPNAHHRAQSYTNKKIVSRWLRGLRHTQIYTKEYIYAP